MIYVIFGVPGVGKTLVINGVIEKTGIELVNWGDLTEEIAKAQGLVEERDDIRKMSFKKQLPIQEKVAQRIIEIARHQENLLIETHAAVKTPQGFWAGLNYDSIRKIMPDTFIALETSAENIMSRRKNDKTRERKDDHTLEEVQTHIRITREMASTFAVLSAGTVFFVENKEGDVDYAVGRIVEMMEKVRS